MEGFKHGRRRRGMCDVRVSGSDITSLKGKVERNKEKRNITRKENYTEENSVGFFVSATHSMDCDGREIT
jgi:hypothetical protein